MYLRGYKPDSGRKRAIALIALLAIALAVGHATGRLSVLGQSPLWYFGATGQHLHSAWACLLFGIRMTLGI